MMSTVIVVTSMNDSRLGAKLNHASRVSTAMISTVGTNTEEILFASRPMAGLLDCAAHHFDNARQRGVAPVFGLEQKVPEVLSVPPVTVSPVFFSTGIGSPVSMDRPPGTPSTITPSTGIFRPGAREGFIEADPEMERPVPRRCDHARVFGLTNDRA